VTVLYALLVLALGVGAGLTVLVIEELRWEARSRAPRRMTYGEVHHRHAAHR
jgi:ABC-type nickel/cobalt efflux system permease component RcnA